MSKSTIQKLIDEGMFTHRDVVKYMNEYNRKNNKKQKRLIQQKVEEAKQEQENQVDTYSQIENGVFVRFDERDIDNGHYTVPKNVHTIKQFAFSSCKKLNSIKLGSNVKTIENDAFFNCGLRFIDLANVESIGGGAFCFCLNLEQVKLSNKLQSVGEAVFYNCMKLEKFITPTGKVIKLERSEFANRTDAHKKLNSYIQHNKELAR